MIKIALTAMVLSFCITRANGWGATGHHVVGEVAYRYLTPKARKKLDLILESQSLATAGTWMDEVRSNRRYNYMSDWHWVTIPGGANYESSKKNPNGDVIQTIGRVMQQLKSGSVSGKKEAMSLKILIHLVGDIHQPLHVGTGLDRGGNETRVKWMGRSSNLHQVWDSDMIDDANLSYADLTSFLKTLSRADANKLQKSDVITWAVESMNLREQVYAIKDGKLGGEYSLHNLETVKRRLIEAGVRLAGILNEIYG